MTKKNKSMHLEQFYESDTLNKINNHLKSIKDNIKQLSAYISWSTRARYLVELRICQDLQGFNDNYSWIKVFDISWDLTEKEFDETKKELQEYRMSKNYNRDMKKLELEEMKK